MEYHELGVHLYHDHETLHEVKVGGKEEKLAGRKARERGNSASIPVFGDQIVNPSLLMYRG